MTRNLKICGMRNHFGYARAASMSAAPSARQNEVTPAAGLAWSCLEFEAIAI